MTQDRLLDKLGKLKKMAEGAKAIGSEAEAQAFAAKLQALLTEHKLEMTDLEFETLDVEEPISRHEIDYREYPDINLGKARVLWLERLAGIVARAHYCRLIVWPKSTRISLVGRKSDAKCAEFMYITLRRAAESLAEAAYRERVNYLWRTQRTTRGAGDYKEGYLFGFIVRLMERYDEERAKTAASSTALVRVNTEEQKLDTFMDELQKSGKTAKSTQLKRVDRVNKTGWDHGRKAADQVRLRSNAVEGAANTVPALKN